MTSPRAMIMMVQKMCAQIGNPFWLLIIPNLCYLIIFQGLPLLKNPFKSFRCFQSALWELSFPPQKSAYTYTYAHYIFAYAMACVFCNSSRRRQRDRAIHPAMCQTFSCMTIGMGFAQAKALHRWHHRALATLATIPNLRGLSRSLVQRSFDFLKGMKWDEMGEKDIESY